jgi:hypothetical protein
MLNTKIHKVIYENNAAVSRNPSDANIAYLSMLFRIICGTKSYSHTNNRPTYSPLGYGVFKP